jgi:signal peptidase I
MPHSVASKISPNLKRLRRAMSKTKLKPPVRTVQPAPAAQSAAKSHAVRETVESIVIAFVLAFLFRTFEAEAFVIPTGSMAPTLMGLHKDVDCPKCGYRYQVSASEEESEDPRRQTSEVFAGQCPMCHYVLPMRSNVPDSVPEKHQGPIVDQKSYNGDRILVNKYLYEFSDPKRWDVVVFKFPGDAKVNYIKRLVGLPGEKLQIYQGDVFLARRPEASVEEFEIARKPPNKILAMRQLVHDTNYDPAELDAVGWPLRWHPSPEGGAGDWKVDKTIVNQNVRQHYTVEAPANSDSWLRYEHLVPTYEVWQNVISAEQTEAKNIAYSDANRAGWRRLITDANPYDGRLDRDSLRRRGEDNLKIDWSRQGLHWVGDLMMEANVDIESAGGELLLDLVEGGQHFTCRINLTNGEAKLSAMGDSSFAPKAKTTLTGAGSHRVAFSNFDDQLLLWVDGKVVEFDASTALDVNRVFGGRDNIIPKTSEKDLGDFAPAGIGARGAKLSVSRLQVWRDIYYIAEDYTRMRPGDPITDFDHTFDMEQLSKLAIDPRTWNRFKERSKNKVVFPLNSEQLFVMGDNSAESSDARLWVRSDRGQPGGPYLEKRLLIGKALCVYWPHSWNRIPGTPIPFPLFPNVGDMRLVR